MKPGQNILRNILELSSSKLVLCVVSAVCHYSYTQFPVHALKGTNVTQIKELGNKPAVEKPNMTT